MTSAHAQPDVDLVPKIERAMARNLRDYVAAYRRLASGSGAACVEVAGGVAAFTGAGSPLTTVKGTQPDLSAHDLHDIETFFGEHRSPVATIETAPWLSEESRQLLTEGGYAIAGEEDVVATIAGGRTAGTAPRAEAIPVDAWPEVMRSSFELPSDSPDEDLVIAAAHLPHARLYGIREGDRWIACAQSVAYDDVTIFGNDGTRPDARRRGAQTALIEERLAAVPPGTIVTAEVARSSGSERNYLRCGFRLVYTRVHYRRELP